MQPEVILVSASVWYGLLRWLMLGLLIVVTLIILAKKDKSATRSRVGFAAFLITIIVTPVLILDIQYKPAQSQNDPETVEPANPDDKKKEKVDPDPVIPDAPDDIDPIDADTASNTTPHRRTAPRGTTDGGSERESGTTPDVKPTPTPTPAPEPSEVTVSYKVYHKKMNLDGSTYTVADIYEGTGTSGKEVTPDLKEYDGFTAPKAQTRILPKTDTLELVYLYTRNKYNFTLNSSEYVATTTPSGEYYYGTPIELTAKNRPGYDFDGWTSNDSGIDSKTDQTISFELGSSATTVEPSYTARTNTPYTIIYRKMNASGTEFVEYNRETKYGTTDTEVSPTPPAAEEGYVTPETQTKAIAGDGSTVFTYDYDRVKYHLEITNADKVRTTTPTGDYYYDTAVTLEAMTVPGYTFDNRWTDGTIGSVKSFHITEDITIGPEYTAKSYKVYFNSNTTDPDVAGSMSPQDMTYDTSVALSDNQFTRTYYEVDGWSTDPNATEATYKDKETVSNLSDGSSDVTLYAVWVDKFRTVFSANRCEFHGKNGVITGDCGDYNGQQYIDTGIALYNEENINKDYEIYFEIVDYSEPQDNNQTTFISLKNLGSSDSTKPGIIVRGADTNTNISFENAYPNRVNVKKSIRNDRVTKVHVFRKDGIIYIGFHDDDLLYQLMPTSGTVTPSIFDNTLFIGGYGDNDRILTGTIQNLRVRLGTKVDWDNYNITFESNGGTVAAKAAYIEKGKAIDNLPPAWRDHYAFMGWWTKASGGTKIENGVVPTSDTSYYAHWAKDAETANLSKTVFEIAREEYDTIQYTETVEPVTYQSNNESIATVDESGKITGTGIGETTITITGSITGKTRTVAVSVILPKYTVHFNTHGGNTISDITNVTEGTTLPSVPENPTRTGYVFDGWWTAGEGGDAADLTTVIINGETTFHAHWKVDVEHATTNKSSYTITEGQTDTFQITNADQLEDYTVSIEDPSIATLEGDTITAVAEGQTKIIVASTTSSRKKEIIVKVTPLTPIVTTVCKPAEELHTQPCVVGQSSGTSGSCAGLTNADIKGGTINNGTITYGHLPNSKSPKAGDAYDCDVDDDGQYDAATERFYFINDDGTYANLYYYDGYDGDNGPSDSASVDYDPALLLLPTSTHWPNPNLIPFDDGNITSFLTYADAYSVCNGSDPKKCIYLLENTVFSQPKGNPGPRTGVWLKKEANKRYRIQTQTLNIENRDNTESNVPRPIIKVKLDDIEAADVVNFTVTWDTHGGNTIAPKEYERYDEIGELPKPIKDGFMFTGWSTTEDGSNIIDSKYTITDNVILHAIWEEVTGKEALIGDDNYYDTLAAAFSAVADDAPQTTIKLLKDVSTSKITISNRKDIVINLRGYTVTNSDTVFDNFGKLVIENGTVNCTNKGGAVNNNAGGTLTVTDGVTIQTSSKQALWNNGGTLYITGNPTLKSTNTSTSNQRATLHNLNNGVAYIAGGTITSANFYAVYNEKGTMIIGTKDGYVNSEYPYIEGKTYGIVANPSYKFYDGVIRGQTYSNGKTDGTGNTPSVSSDTANERIAETEDDTTIVKDEDGVYKVLYLSMNTPKYLISFDANGGTTSAESMTVVQGEPIGTLPTAQKAGSEFLGWYTEREGGILVTENTAPTENETYYAHWQAHDQDQIISFNIQNEAVQNYLNSVSSWKSNETNLLANLKSNFDDHNCKYSSDPDVSLDFKGGTYDYKTTGTILCDQQNVFDTNVNGAVTVRISDETTKVKNGAIASYITSNNGKLTNFIPGITYYWESDADSSIYGYIKAEAVNGRRMLTLPSTRNVRDLGGLVGKDGKKIKYGKLIRGEKIFTASDASALDKLGVDTEYDLRGSNNENKISGTYVPKETIHYNFNTDKMTNYDKTRAALVSFMNDAIAGKTIYFHCTHGADRTGTIAYLAETLLGVSEEDIDEDYELTTFSGRADRTRFYDHKTPASSSFDPDRKYKHMLGFARSYADVYAWFTYGHTDTTDDDALIEAFQNAMLE